MNRKIHSLIIASSIALFFAACGDDNSSSAPDSLCTDSDCIDEEYSSSSEEDGESSSSAEKDAESSSSVEDTPESSSSAEVSSSSEEATTLEYANTTPNAADLETSGDTLFAVFQRQNADYTVTHNGLLALYNLNDGTLLDTIQLATKNPSAIKVVNGNVYVATAGEYDASYALPADENRGIEKVNLSDKTSSLFVSGTKLGGGVNDFVVDTKNNKGYALIYESYGNAFIVEVNLSSGSATTIGTDVLKDPEGGLEFDETNSVLYVGDRYLDWYTYEMNVNVYKYDGSTFTYISDSDPSEEVRMPYSIKTINGVPYVFVSDYSTGALYLNYADSEDEGLSFYQDSKLAVVNDELYVMVRETSTASIAKINVTSSSVTKEASVSGLNPYDMVAANSSSAWIAYYGSALIELVSTSDFTSIKTIDTQEFCAVKVE